MSFKLFIRTRPLKVGILLNSPATTGDLTISGWKLPFQGLWTVDRIGGGGGSGSYNNSHANGSEAGFNGNFSSNTTFLHPDSTGTVTLGGGGLGGQIVGATFNAGSAGGVTSFAGGNTGGGAGGAASDGSPKTSTRTTSWSPSYNAATTNYFLGTAYTYTSASTSTGTGGNGVYGGLVSNLNGLSGNRGAILVTCVG